MRQTPKLSKPKTVANQGLLPFEGHGPFATPESATQELPVALPGPAEPVALPGPESVTSEPVAVEVVAPEGSMTPESQTLESVTPEPVAPVLLDWRSGSMTLTAAEFLGLAEVPPELEWFANIRNERTRRAYQQDVRDAYY